MKIAHLLLTHQFAGSERYAIELANEQAERHEVTLILPRRASAARPDALTHRLDPRVRVVLVPDWRPLAILAARRAVRHLAPDVAHAHLGAAELALRGPETPYLRIATLHGNYDARRHGHLDAMIAATPWQLAGIPGHQLQHTRQINSWTLAPAFDPAARARIRTSLGLADDEFLIGTLGRVERDKGLDVLVEAFTRAAPSGARLAIVGDGSQWRRLRRQACAGIIMPGFTDRPQDWLGAFDAFVSPARDEPVGLVLLEAMASDLPILATATRGARQLASRIGRPLALPGSTADLAEALRQLARERPTRRTYDLDGFRLPQQVQQIEEFYRQEVRYIHRPGKPQAAVDADANSEADTGSDTAPNQSAERGLRIVQMLLTSRFAGSERHAIELANEQARRHRVSMILSARGAENRADALAHRLDPRVEVIRIPFWGPLRNLLARRAVRRLAPDVAHAHLSNAARALHGLRRPATLRISTLHIHYKRSQHRDIDALIAVAPWQLAQIPATQREHARQINNWTRIQRPAPGARRRLRATYGLADDVFLIGALCRTVHSKGLDVLIEAFTRLDPPGARLAIVGHGKEWRRLRNQAPGSIIMPGFTDRPHDWLSAFDTFVSAARFEALPLTYLEAMAAGLPVLATANEGAQHLESLIGRPLVPIGDADAMTEALRTLVADRPPRRVYDLVEFQLGRQARQIEDFYRQELVRPRACAMAR